ncbi:unnamed protein product [Acanthoscelides obtectus]|uniref:Uncharacterized protein n=1 Tax=Acanthoscelides obtectus TaxID=200917 RepID=A0A9P0KQN8_ACAOB|nr:unnamed protein product [Acanthoscelides obtectus]CAK1641936.1 hypothetical protein AOBTE_LOCUS12736 [Acanthoscelides obtectus]
MKGSSHSTCFSPVDRALQSPINAEQIQQDGYSNSSLRCYNSPQQSDYNDLEENSEVQNTDILSAAIGDLFEKAEF